MNDQERIKLVHASITAATTAINDELANIQRAMNDYPDTFNGGTWGDNEDYLNAAVDQLVFLIPLMGPDGDLNDIDKVISASQEELDTWTGNGYPAGFCYGYADHKSPLSDLMNANKED